MARKTALPKFADGQPVTLKFNDGATLEAHVVERIADENVAPLTDYWRVRLVGAAASFGFSGSAIEARP